MAKNEKTPAERAQYSYDTKKEYDKLYTPKDRAKDRYKANKEYRKLEKRDKLPNFIITIVVFILFIGIFLGLYNSADYDLKDYYVKNFHHIDMISARDSLSNVMNLSFSSFFLTLGEISSAVNDTRDKYFSAYTVSFYGSEEYTAYISFLYMDCCNYINENYPFLIRWYVRRVLQQEVINRLTILKSDRQNQYFKSIHIANIPYVNPNIYDFGIDVTLLHDNLVKYSFCHCYNDVLYCYCGK